jgi:tRNA(Ile)-lysidine synthase
MPRATGRARIRPPVEEAFLHAVERYAMVRRGDRLLAAVSGGGDSVLMLHLLIGHQARCPFSIHVAHLNHGLRGAESDEDEAFVRDLAARHALPLTCSRADLARVPGGPSSVEERARNARHEFLRTAARASGCARIALGHTLDDQAETVLMWLLRGAGRGGLSGMEPVTREGLIRPLIGVRRKEARSYLRDRQIPCRDDATNDDPTRLRNRIRARLIPLLEEEFDDPVETIAGEAALLAEEESYLDARALELLGTDGSPLFCDLAGSSAPALLRRAVRLAAEAAGLPARALHRDHIEAIVVLMRDGGDGKGLSLPGGFRVERREGRVFFLRLPENAGREGR